MKIIYRRVETDEELNQILALQRANIPASISEEEKYKEGFLTVHHSFETLKAMNDKCSHIIAKYENKVVGYALSMVKEFKDTIKVLKPMFQEIDGCVKNNYSYITMGQICIDKAFRKQGVFRGLYEFDVIITEVDNRNTRSVNAHKAIGFELLKKYASNNQDGELIIGH